MPGPPPPSQDKRAAIGSGVMIIVYAVTLGLILGLVVVPMITLANATLQTAAQMQSQMNNP
jgi:hypothetical protein